MRTFSHAGILMALLSAFAATPVHSQQPTEIVVIGQAPEKMRNETESYLNQVGVAAGERPTSRWFDPICPRAIGLQSQQAALAERQIREISTLVGAPLAKDGCSPNFAIVFTGDGGAVVRQIAKKESTRLREVPASAQNELKQGTAPVRWWYETEIRESDGRPMIGAPPPSLMVFSVGGMASSGSGTLAGTVPSNEEKYLNHYSSSAVSTQVVRALRSATVIVDVSRAKGKPLSSVVAYAAMVGLAEIRQGAAPGPSILSLFSNKAIDDLTFSDTAFLKSLYRVHMDRTAEQQRRTLVGGMLQERKKN